MAMIQILLVTLLSSCTLAFVNDWDGRAYFVCPNNQYLNFIHSIHDNYYEDRRWHYRCTGSGASEHCYWSGYVNEWDSKVSFMCSGNSVITGMDSYHDNHREDRRFKFRCCGIQGKVPYACYYTQFVNDWDGDMTLTLQYGQVLKGAYSYHRNDKEDRRWYFYVCKI